MNQPGSTGRDDEPSRSDREGSVVDVASTDQLLRAALEEAYSHKSALYGLYERLRAAGHAYASQAAYEASETSYQLVVQLSKDVEKAQDG